MKSTHLYAMCTFILAVAACYVGPIEETSGPSAAAPGASGAVDAGEAGSTSSGPSPGAPAGLPCELEAVLKKSCQGCHGAPLSAPMPLLRHEDLTAPAKSDASRTVAEVMIARMRDSARPMPPSGPLPSAEVNVVERWVAAGYPRGTCGSAAAPDAASVPPEVIVSQCSSGRYWTEGDEKSPYMNPGLPCISCHAKENAERGRLRAPNLLGGTVYPTVREPNLCEGVQGGATVVITDAQQRQFSFPVNRAGNFYAFSYDAAGLTFPIRAKVVAGGKERAMGTPQMTGDCNSCHTEQGQNGAPGRIFLPK